MKCRIQERVILVKKKAPAKNAPGLVGMGFLPKIPKSQSPNCQNPQILKISNFQIWIFTILDAKQSKTKSQIAVVGKVSELAIKKQNTMNIF